MNPDAFTHCRMCGAAIEVVSRKCRFCGETLTRIAGKSWLRRTVEMVIPEGVFLVEYSGRGVFDAVWVRPGDVAKKFGIAWFVRFFDFEVGGHTANVEVRIWPWLVLRLFVLRLDGKVLYTEPGDDRVDRIR